MKKEPYVKVSLSIIVALFLFNAGCGNSDRLDRGYVSGTVTLDGQPLASAAILFRPAQGRAGRGEVRDGKIIRSGTYEENDGLVLGTHLVAVQPIYGPAPSQSDPNAEKSKLKSKQGAGYGGTASAKIPRKYRNLQNSGLTAEITSGENELTIELTSK